MDSIVRSGCIHSWGVSNWQLLRLAAALDYSRRWGRRRQWRTRRRTRLPSHPAPCGPIHRSHRRAPAAREIPEAKSPCSVEPRSVHVRKWSRADSEDFFEVALDEDNGAVGARCSYVALTATDHTIRSKDPLRAGCPERRHIARDSAGYGHTLCTQRPHKPCHCHTLPIHGSFAACHPSAGYASAVRELLLLWVTSLKHWNDNVKAARIGSKVLTQKPILSRNSILLTET